MDARWEQWFKDKAKPPGQTEQSRCDNAVSSIRNALNVSTKLKSRGISIFAQGSYRNNTNVRRDSDVDIGILCTDSLLNDFPEGMSRDDFGLISASYKYEQFKDDIEDALVQYFGRAAVKRGNKAFDIKETSFKVEADVAAFFEHRRYSKDGSYIEGVALRTDKGVRIINWPVKHYDNGVSKNLDTGKRYKSIVRVLKALSNKMAEENVQNGDIPGFLIECLAWNVPNGRFQNATYAEDVRESLIFLYNNTKSDELCKEWGEVSELKYLFRTSQKWTREQANAFTIAAWNYVGFEG